MGFRRLRISGLIAMILALLSPSAGVAAAPIAQLRLHLVSSLPEKHHSAPAVAWLEPMPGTTARTFVPTRHYTLLQKNRTFIPHLQVVPVGSVVSFPNDDPFFHNVFSLFNGKRFDLGLYEAGSSKSVTFSKVGISYIFCNIHPEMSAVIVSLSTPFYAIADGEDSLEFSNVPSGEYKMNIWVEGVPQTLLDTLSRTIRITDHPVDLGDIRVPIRDSATMSHRNKFGRSYDKEPASPY
jgi:plastocyanin